MEDPPLEDPGAANRPIGVLALTGAAVRCNTLTTVIQV